MATSGGRLKKRQALKNAGTYLFCEVEGYSESTVIMVFFLVWKKKDIQDDGPAPSHKRAQSNPDETDTTKKKKGVATKPKPSAVKGNKQKLKYLPPAFESDDEEPQAAVAPSASSKAVTPDTVPVKAKGAVLPAKVSQKNKPTEDSEEEDDEGDTEEESEADDKPKCQPGEDTDDYEDVTREQREFEQPKWKTSASSSRVPANLEDEDGTDGDTTFYPPTLAPTDNDVNSLNAPVHHTDNSGDDTEVDKSKITTIPSGRSKLSTRRERTQKAERPNWHKAASTTKSKKLVNISVADNNDSESSDDDSPSTDHTIHAIVTPASPVPSLSPTLYAGTLADSYVPTRPQTPAPSDDGLGVGDSHLPGDPYDPAEHLSPHPDAHEQLWPARFTQLILTSNPFVLAYRRGTDQQYGKPVHATPQCLSDLPVYTDDDLVFLNAESGLCQSVDRALLEIKDLTLLAEVHRFHSMCAGYAAKEREVLQKVQELERIRIDRKLSVIRLQRANAIERIEDQRDGVGHGRMLAEKTTKRL
ncbi:hypothetical protein EDB85DRAFT_2148805 [Lactarius pseudohatsudake]|nr:hypothetical protein EDB85DRAFT_2148805 [Lactarius pseudohatsudake]